MKRAWSQIKDDVDETEIDRLELLVWSIQTLMSAAGQPKQQKNPGAVVACIKQLDWMTGLGNVKPSFLTIWKWRPQTRLAQRPG